MEIGVYTSISKIFIYQAMILGRVVIVLIGDFVEVDIER
jgi:hypothetical protein